MVAYTFPPRGPSLLTLQAKVHLLREHADEVVVASWERVGDLSPAAFVRDELVGRLGAVAVVAGPDHRFGRDRAGDVAVLQGLAPALGLAVYVVAPLRWGDDVISAGRIRDLIAEGEVEKAARLLGRPVWLAGSPTPGMRLGRRLGYPTVNLALAPELVRPRRGVYAAWVQWPQGEDKALFYIGDRPTFPGLPPSAEVHLFTPPQGPLAGPVEVHLMAFLRPDQRFPSEAALVHQIGEDRRHGERILAGAASPSRLLPAAELRPPRAAP